jgi:hypothetical protein
MGGRTAGYGEAATDCVSSVAAVRGAGGTRRGVVSVSGVGVACFRVLSSDPEARQAGSAGSGELA